MHRKTVNVRNDLYMKTIQWIKMMRIRKSREDVILFGTIHPEHKLESLPRDSQKQIGKL